MIDIQAGGLEVVLAIAAAAWALLVAWKAFDYVRMDRRRRREEQADHGE